MKSRGNGYSILSGLN